MTNDATATTIFDTEAFPPGQGVVVRSDGRVVWRLVIALGVLWACDEHTSPPPPPPPTEALAIDSLRPAPGTLDVDLGSDIAVYFSRPLDPQTVRPATIFLTLAGDTIPSRLAYDSVARAVHLTAPLLPGSVYALRVTTGLTDSGGVALPADTLSVIKTHAAQTVVIDTGPNPAYTSLAISPTGVVHVTYEVGNHTLKYAECQTACVLPGAWTRVTVDSTFAVGRFNALALDDLGGLHISYPLEFGAGQALEYATCTSACDTPAGWQHAVADTGRAPDWITAIGIDGSGRIAVTSPDNGLLIALCSGGCLSRANWGSLVLTPTAYAATLLVENVGRLHVAYYNNQLWYATCASDCLDPAQWTQVLADTAYAVGNNPSLALDRNGRLHISSYAFARRGLRYATCTSLCHLASSWTALTVDSSSTQGGFSALMVDEADRIRIVHGTQLRYSSCTANCTLATQWRTGALAPADGGYLSAKLDRQGHLHVTYLNYGSGHIMYLQ